MRMASMLSKFVKGAGCWLCAYLGLTIVGSKRLKRDGFSGNGSWFIGKSSSSSTSLSSASSSSLSSSSSKYYCPTRCLYSVPHAMFRVVHISLNDGGFVFVTGSAQLWRLADDVNDVRSINTNDTRLQLNAQTSPQSCQTQRGPVPWNAHSKYRYTVVFRRSWCSQCDRLLAS